MVGSVVCTVYTDDKPYKPCVLCQTGFTQILLYLPVHEILVRVAYAQKPPLNDHANVSSQATGLNFCLSVHHYPNFVHASSKGSCEHAHLRIIA